MFRARTITLSVSLAGVGVVCLALLAPASAAPLTCQGFTATILGTRGPDVLRGTPGGDVILGLGGADIIRGLGGDDLVCAGGGDDRLVGGAGYDALFGGPGNDALLGGSETDGLRGGAGNDELSGGSDGDTLWAGAGDDLVDGGDGWDWVSYSESPVGVTVDLSAGWATGEGSDMLVAIESLDGSPFDDTLIGDGADNIFTMGLGDDSVSGGGGNDTISFLQSAQGVTADIRFGTATGEGSDTFTGIENLYGSPQGDILLGDGGSNWIYGDLGDDTVFGDDGDDHLFGGDGTDAVDGGNGSDECAEGETTLNCEA